MLNGRFWTDLAALLIHSVFASLSVIIGVAFGLTLLMVTTHGGPSLRRRLIEMVCLFIFLGVPAVCGLLINLSARNRAACMVWAVGLLFLLIVAAWDISIFKRSPYYQRIASGEYLSYESNQLFGTDAEKWGRGGGLEEMLVMVPVLGSFAYSFGAWFALRSAPQTESAKRTTS